MARNGPRNSAKHDGRKSPAKRRGRGGNADGPIKHSLRRFTRLTNAFSKKFENHCHMVALYAVWYNFIRIHKTLRVTPAMQAGIIDRLFSYEELIGIVDEWEESQKNESANS